MGNIPVRVIYSQNDPRRPTVRFLWRIDLDFAESQTAGEYALPLGCVRGHDQRVDVPGSARLFCLRVHGRPLGGSVGIVCRWPACGLIQLWNFAAPKVRSGCARIRLPVSNLDCAPPGAYAGPAIFVGSDRPGAFHH